MRRALTGLGIVVLTGGLLAGCGDDDGDAVSGDDTSSAEFCAQAGALQQRLADLEDSAQPTPALFREVSEAFGGLADDAPDEIADDMDTLASALATFADVFEQVDPDDPASLAVLEEEAERLEEQSDDLQEAGDNVEAYFRDECGIDLDGPGATDDGAGTTEGGDGGDDGGGTTTTDGPTGSDELDDVLEDEEG